jgi:hypothetical protein
VPIHAHLRAYLFHKEMKKWLDTMVWSNMQPHSINDKVGRRFGDGEGEEGGGRYWRVGSGVDKRYARVDAGRVS